jgi:hypothetical protein
MRFERILLAGSVLPTSYDWQGRVRDNQVDALRNDRAARDIPVGMLCSGLRGLFMRDIGTGGVDGFLWEDPRKTEVYYYRGGHGAALASDNLPRLASFVMDGTSTQPDGLMQEPSGRFAMLSRAAPVFAWLIVAGVVAAAIAFIDGGPLAAQYDAAVLLGGGFFVFLVLDLV